MAYKVIAEFLDKKDDKYKYSIGDIFPRKGKRPSKARKEEIADKGFIKEVE